jgi:hypothetical protein
MTCKTDKATQNRKTPRMHREGREYGGIKPLILNLGKKAEVSVQLHAPAALSPE